MEIRYKRSLFSTLRQRIMGPRRFIQVLAGPRQTGKTTLARQLSEDLPFPAHFASADEPTLQDRSWLAQQWDIARLLTGRENHEQSALIIIDEIQKVPAWSETIKRLWDQDTASGLPLRALLVGSSPLLVRHGLTESLAGRFEIIPVPHWSWPEMRDAFGWNLERFAYFGGYPGAAPLIDDEQRWRRYVTDSLIETTVSRDILLLTRVDKPALLRRLFHLGCSYSGQVLSYQKMLGQLQDAGNTVTLAHYLELLQGAGLLAGLPKYSGQQVRQRSSSPKLQVLNTALMTALSHTTFASALADRNYWGRLIESAIGGHLLNSSHNLGIDVYYWLDRNREVDFVLSAGENLTAIEVKSGRQEFALPGMESFAKVFPATRRLLVGTGGIPIGEFLSREVSSWV